LGSDVINFLISWFIPFTPTSVSLISLGKAIGNLFTKEGKPKSDIVASAKSVWALNVVIGLGLPFIKEELTRIFYFTNGLIKSAEENIEEQEIKNDPSLPKLITKAEALSLGWKYIFVKAVSLYVGAGWLPRFLGEFVGGQIIPRLSGQEYLPDSEAEYAKKGQEFAKQLRTVKKTYLTLTALKAEADMKRQTDISNSIAQKQKECNEKIENPIQITPLFMKDLDLFIKNTQESLKKISVVTGQEKTGPTGSGTDQPPSIIDKAKKALGARDDDDIPRPPTNESLKRRSKIIIKERK